MSDRTPDRHRARPALGVAVRALLAAALAVPLAGHRAAADEVRSLRVSHVHQVPADRVLLRAYLDVLDEGGEPLRALPPAALEASLGARRVELTELEPLERTDHGVAYVFLVDVSRSLSDELFERLRDSIGSWIADMDGDDRAAILAFGETSRVVVDFTSDVEALERGLASLGPTDDLTLLNQAIADGLELARRRDPEIPGRRVLIVLTDGRDEGSGLGDDDVLAELRERPAPLYAIGFSQIRTAAERRRHLDLLRRFATVSGGAFYEAEATGLERAYREIRVATRRLWVASFLCSGCPADGRLYRFQATLDLDGKVLTDGASVRVLPVAAPAPPAVTEEPAAAPPPAPAASEDEPRDGRSPAPLGRLALAAAAALLALLLMGCTVRGPRPRRPSDTGATELAGELEREVLSEEVAPADTRKPAGRSIPSSQPPRSIRLVVVRGAAPGRQYRMILQDRATVGRRSTCACVLSDEPSIEPEQFELVQRAGKIYLRNLSEAKPTLHDGLPIEEHAPLESNDLVGTREVILRVLFDSLG